MSSISSIKTWTSEVLYAADLNSWFTEIRSKVNTYGAWLDNNQTFTGNQTFSGTIAANGAVTTAAGITVNTTGITIAPQTAITFSHASARIIPGSTGLYFRNNANSADNVAITDAGAVTIRADLTITGALSGVTTLAMSGALSGVTTLAASGVVTLSATGACLTFSGANPQIKIGATSLTMLNSAGSGTLSTLSQTGHRLWGNNGAQSISLGYSSSEFQLGNTAGNIILGQATAAAATANLPVIPYLDGIPSGTAAPGALAVYGTKLYFYTPSLQWVSVQGA